MSSPAHTDQPKHVPVLPREVVELLAPQPGEIWVDATAGVGGHAQLLGRQIGIEGKLICIDRDESMLRIAKRRLQGNGVFWQANFDRLHVLFEEMNLQQVDGLLGDLGFCSDQVDDPKRGLSFQRDGPLDMRLQPDVGERASDLLERLSERELADVFWQFGEERFSRRIARKIVETRKLHALTTTAQLAELVRCCVSRSKKRGPAIDPATRVFQALRIAVNDELGALKRLLNLLPSCIRPGGRAGFISFHSLEDRLVKRAFRDGNAWEELNRKPVQATPEEVNRNPRARSAKLRVARRADDGSR